MKLRRLAPLATAVAVAGAALPAAHAARPTAPSPQSVSVAKRTAVVRPSAHSVDVLRLQLDRREH